MNLQKAAAIPAVSSGRQALSIGLILSLILLGVIAFSLNKHLHDLDQQMLQSARLLEKSLTRTLESVETYMLIAAQQFQNKARQDEPKNAELMREILRFSPHIRQMVLVHDDLIVADSHGNSEGERIDWQRLGVQSRTSQNLNQGLRFGLSIQQRFLPLMGESATAYGSRSVLPVVMQFSLAQQNDWFLIAALNPQYLQALLQEARVLEHSQISLLRFDGQRLLGSSDYSLELVQQLLQLGLQEQTEFFTPFKAARLSQLARVSSRYDFVLYDAYSPQQQVLSWFKQNASLLLFLVLLLLFAGLMLMVYLQQVKRRVSLQREVHLLYEAIEQLPMAVLLLNEAQQIRYLNPSMSRLFGYRPGQLQHQSLELLRSGFDELDWQRMQSNLQQGKLWQGELSLRVDDQSPRCIRVHLSPVSEGGDESRYIVALFQDISESRQAEQQIRIASVAFEVQEAILVMDHNKRILRVNHAFEQLTGYEAQRAVGHRPGFLQSNRHSIRFYRDIIHAVEAQGTWQGEVYYRRANGDDFPVWLNFSSVVDSQGRISHYVSSFSDISSRKQHEEKIEQLAYYDPLTGLPNRRLFQDRFEQASIKCARNHQYAALIMLDLDHFKSINDTLGHDHGDHLLQEVSTRLRQVMREQDTLARMGGDEFLILLEGLSSDLAEAEEHSARIAAKILDVLQQPSASLPDQRPLGASLGIKLFGAPPVDREEVMKQADLALYEAKKQGRNRYQLFAESLQSQLNHQVQIESEFRQAIDQQRLQLHFQPQVNLQQQVCGAEALVRWKQGDMFLSPAVFIPIAEKSDLILKMGDWVLQQACAALQQWQNLDHFDQFQLAVNISPRQFAVPDFIEQLQSLVEQYGIKAQNLRLELTENLMLNSIADTSQKLTRLNELGFGVDLDDFGTGFSSLSYLHQLPLEAVKIDSGFVREINRSRSAESIVRSILMMAKAMNIEVIAEGVETQEQLQWLKSQGCRKFQGYLFSRALPEGDFVAYWRDSLKPNHHQLQH